MSTKERIMTIRLLEKLQKYPAQAKVLGITVSAKHSTGQRCSKR